MTAAARRSANQIDPISMEIAQTLARQSGLSLSDWIASLMGAEASEPAHGEEAPGRLEAPPHPADAAGELASAVRDLGERLEAIESRPADAAAGIDQTVEAAIARLVEAGREQVAVAARFEGAVAEIGLEQARLADRLARVEQEGSPRRSTEALRALEGTLGKMAGRLYEDEGRTKEAIEEITAKLRRVEAGQGAAPSKIADSIALLARNLEDAEARTRQAMAQFAETLRGVGERLDAVEAAGLGAASAERLEEANALTGETLRGLEESLSALDARLDGVHDAAHAAASGERLDAVEARSAAAIAALQSRLVDLETQAATTAPAERIDEVEARTAVALRALGQSLGALDDRLGAAERTLPELAQSSALEDVTRDLLDRVDAAAAQTGERLAAEAEARLEGMERSVSELNDRSRIAEQHSLEAIGAIGREVVDLSDSLVRRVQAAETRNAQAVQEVGAEVSRIAQGVEARFAHADSVQAQALETLGDEIARISERLAERIAAADRRSAQAIEEVGDQMARATERLSQRHERTSEDFAERIRLGEERTTRVLAQARDEIERISQARRRASDLAAFSAGRDEEQAPLFGDDPFAVFSSPPPAAQAARPDFSQEDLDLADSFPAADVVGAEEPTAPFPSSTDPRQFEALMGADLDTPVPEPAAATPLPTAARPASSSGRAAAESARAAILASTAARTTSRKDSPPIPFSSGGASGPMFPKRAFGEQPLRTGGGGAAALGLGLAAAMGLAIGGFWFIQSEPHRTISDEMAALLPGGAPARGRTAPAGPSPGAGAAPRFAMALAPNGASIHPLVPSEDLPEVYAGAVTRLAAHDGAALEDLRHVAALGYAPAQFYLAKLYETGGYGVAKDPAAARLWTTRAAQGGDARAMHNLALDYYEGTGGPRDVAQAAQWFSRAAAMGLADSQYNLGLLYEEGRGVPQNAAEAYKWYLIASRSGDADSRANAQRIAAQLSPQARLAAERSAAAFRPTQPSAAAAIVTAPSAVASAQKALSALGYYEGPSDGAASPALRLALSAYQRDQGLPATGLPDAATIAKLRTAER